MASRLKQAGKVTESVSEELMPPIKGGVTVKQLEEIAVKSQAGMNAKEGGGDFTTTLADYQYYLGPARPKLDYLRKRFPGDVLLCAIVDCDEGAAVAELNRFRGVEAFGTGGDFLYEKRTGLPKNRYIASDSRGLPGIPDNSFHLVMHTGMDEPLHDLKQQISAIYRVTKPGGLAVLDVENRNMFLEIVHQLGITSHVYVVHNKSGEKTGLVQFVNSVVDMGEKDPIRASQRAYDVHFELHKPMAVEKRKPGGRVPHYESATQGPFTGVPIWAKRQAGVMKDGEHAPPGGCVPGFVENLKEAEAELPRVKKFKEER